MKQEKKRNINIELLRILSMLLIVYHHYSVHSSWIFPNSFSKRTALINIIGNFGKIGVIIFVLITGYFYSKQRFSVKKIFQLSTIARWYTIPALVISFLFIEKGLHMSLQDIVKAIFPISFSEYWFLTSFVVILILQPILQPFLVSANRIQKLKMTGLVTLLCHIPSFIGLVSQTDNYFFPSIELVFVYVILVGDLIKSFEQELSNKYFKFVVLFFTGSLLLIIFKGVVYQPYIYNELPKIPYWFLNGTESINAIIFAGTTFIMIKKIKIKKLRFILFLSPLVFDVYLIHDNNYMRSLIWEKIFDNKNHFNSSFLLFRSLLEPLVVFSICILLAFFRGQISSFIAKMKKVSLPQISASDKQTM